MAFEEKMFLVFVITVFHVAVMAKMSMKFGGKYSLLGNFDHMLK